MADKIKKNKFIFNWILFGKLALGTIPKDDDSILYLKSQQIDFIFSLCDLSKIENEEKLNLNFEFFNYFIPDHTYEKKIKIEDLFFCTSLLNKILTYKNVFIHCEYSIERSPLICFAYLMKYKGLNLIESMQYIKEIHNITNLTNHQLEILKKFASEIKAL